MEMVKLYVGIDSWIIQDGNYGDFRAGETAEFALEFYPHSIDVSTSQEASCKRLRGCQYRIRGQVVYVDRSAWVVDFGVMAYQNSEPPKTVDNGSWVEGEVYLGIDPFFYFEELHALPAMPELHYEWHINTILLETTPWLTQTDERGRTILTRDQEQESFTQVSETNAWSDDDGNAHYVLECVKADEAE